MLRMIRFAYDKYKLFLFMQKKGYNNKDKIVILDEADNITQKAQYLLSNLINDFSVIQNLFLFVIIIII